MKYDDASWHVHSVETGTEDERWACAATHIGLYVKWCFRRGWAGALHRADDPESVQSVCDGSMLGSDFVLRYSGKFTDEDLSGEGNEFTRAYYERGFLEVAGEVAYVPEHLCDFDALSARLDADYERWLAGDFPASPSKPWWKFW